MKVLVVDDEESITRTLRDDLQAAGHAVDVCHDGEDGLEILKAGDIRYDCMVTDLRLPGMHGMDLLEHAQEQNPELEVIVITGHSTVDSAVEAMKKGAFDYLQKPFMNDEVIMILERIDEFKQLRDTSKKYDALKGDQKQYERLVGQGEAMREVFQTIETLSDSEVTVLLQGESGTGKELVAEAIHEKSPRSDGPLVKFSCAGFPESLIDAELFGHEKGAFTGAVESHEGRFQRADGGTIFLDDIDDMELDTQTKFLRVLQEKEIDKLGGEETIPVDIRVITSSKVDLQERVDEGLFREDLYYRLNVVNLYIPPLRNRREDIPLLAQHFLEMYDDNKGCSIAEETLNKMQQYDWPGNVRELENAVQRAIALAGPDDELEKTYLVPENGDAGSATEERPAAGARDAAFNPEDPDSLDDFIDRQRKQYVRRVLEQVDGERKQAADLLGVSRKTLWKYIKKYDL